MELQDRNLMLGIQGDDVKQLQHELNQLGWRLNIDGDFGRKTQAAVFAFEQWLKQQRTAMVNESIAGLINKALESLHDCKFWIKGLVRDPVSKRGLMGIRVEAWDKDWLENDKIGEELTREDGTFLMSFDETIFSDFFLDREPDLFFKIYEGDELVKDEETEGSVRWNVKAGETEVTIEVTGEKSGSTTKRQIEGRIVFENGVPAEYIKLRLYRLEFGGKAELLAETATGKQGSYFLPYDVGSTVASLEIRAVDATEKEVPLSRPLNYLGTKERQVINLGAPTTLLPLAAEYQRLLIDLKPHIADLKKLADLKETAHQQDITILNRATGWDARLIALTAIATRLSQDPDVNLPHEAIYGLLRAGLPSDKLILAQVDVDVVVQALKRTRDAGIVEFSDEQIEQLKQPFISFAEKVRLNVAAPGSHSTYKQLLEASGLSADAQAKFAQVYLGHRGDTAQFWKGVRNAGLDDTQIGKLQLQGQLAFLVGNSAVMTKRLMQSQVNNPVQLVEDDFYLAESWRNEIFTSAGIPENHRNNLTNADKKKLEAIIPVRYVDEEIKDRINAYAEDMARKVRLSFPTQVVGRMIEQDAADTFKLGDERANTAALLKSAAGQGFRLGQTPVNAFFETHVGVVAGLSANELQETRQRMMMLHRVFQITPSNEAMPVLLSLGMTSAYDVMAYSETMFADMYTSAYFNLYGRQPTRTEIELVYRKAQQVSSVTYNLFTIAKKFNSETHTDIISAPIKVRESVRNQLIKQFPTMESLFGSMDFCECEHCRSVLSPAAYMVDLLQFVDIEKDVWANFLAHWKTTHNNQEYTAKYTKPYAALIARRPDLPHISLTCENTHTALPYIDIVNEILEYYVANGKLEENAVHDTGEATTSELLAEPQNVIYEAYDKLRETRYPLNLPFDLWTETVRQFCDYFETPLAKILEVFRRSNELFVSTQPFDRSSVFFESLGLSFAETAIFTDPEPLKKSKWYTLYGFPVVRPGIQNPTNIEHASFTLANDDAKNFRAGMICSYFDVSTNTLSAENMAISAIGLPDTGGAGRTKVTLRGIWNIPPDAGDHLVFDAPATLKSAKTLSRRLGVTYKQIVDIVKTGFVNPELQQLVIIDKLGVSINDVRFYLDNKVLIAQDPSSLSEEKQKRRLEAEAFAHKLKTLADEFHISSADLEAKLQNIPFDRILLLADPDASCNFDLTTLRYANGNSADDIVFLRINLFVRLWRKLGWSIEETDLALQAFVPRNAQYQQANLNKQPLKTALIYLAHLVALNKQVGVGKKNRIKLITLWADINRTGKKSLYAQLFLTRSMLKTDAVFDDPLGLYLSATGIKKMAQSRKHKVQLGNVPPANKIDPAHLASKPKIQVRYDALQEVQHLSYEGILNDADKATLNALSPSTTLPTLLDAVQLKAQEFLLIKGHLLALQGALGLTASEITRILSDAGMSIDVAKLSMATVSLLYRYSLLAKALKLTVQELIALKQLSALEPFKLLHSDPISSLDKDYPFTQTIRFVELVAKIKGSGFKIEDLDYLLRHRFEATGKYRPNQASTLALLKSLAKNVHAIRSKHAVPEDPGQMSDEVLRQKLGLALPADVAETFLAMMKGTIEFTATKTGVQPADKLSFAAFSEMTSISDVSYNAPRQEQKLTFRGVLFAAQKTALENSLSNVLTAAQQAIFADLLSLVQVKAKQFFKKYLQKQALNAQSATGFLDAADFELLFDLNRPLAAGETEQDRLRKRRAKLVNAFLPFLQSRLIRQTIVQSIIAHTGGNPALVESLITDDRLLANPKSLLEPLSGLSERGITTVFFASADGTGAPLATVSLTDASTSLKDKDGNPFKPAGTNSARFDGYLEVLDPGVYRFYVVLEKQNAKTELRFAHLVQPTLTGTAAHDNDEVGIGLDEFVELKPGIPYRYTVDLHNLNGGDASLLIQGETLPKSKISQLVLYPLTAMENAERAILLLTKTLQILQTLIINEREARYLLTHASDFDSLDLSKLPWRDAQQAIQIIARQKVKTNPILNPEQAMLQARNENPNLAAEVDQVPLLFKQMLRLIGYALLKREMAVSGDDLIAIFEVNGEGDIDRVYALIAKFTRRSEATINACAKALYSAPNFNSEKPLNRLWELLQVVERFGVPVPSLLNWTRIVNPSVIPEQRFEIARDLKETIKARFEQETWQRIAQPIFDKLRQYQRDALVSYVMHQHGFARMEQLYEYFLIDPGMEPVVQTSRIRLAIGSVQLFIQRCLLNLEKQVHPSSIINAKQWEWIKRYRVWEANRKIFLFPENWLEPEFRDDKTHLFNELEGALLQGDVSNDLVEDAFLNYLKKLDELARLDIVAMHLEESLNSAQNTLHVFGRSFSQPHNYFYRRYIHQMWTPWEPVSAEIGGDHLAPVLWRDRLYLFWITFMNKPDENQQPGTKTHGKTVAEAKLHELMSDVRETGKMKQIDVQLHWSEYIQGEWSTRQSSDFFQMKYTWFVNLQGNNPPIKFYTSPLKVPLSFDEKTVFIHVSKEPYENGQERGVFIHLKGPDNFQHSFYLAGRNSGAEEGQFEVKPVNPYSQKAENTTHYSGSGAFTVNFKQRITTESGKSPSSNAETLNILQKGEKYNFLPCNNKLENPGVSEDVYQNAADPNAVRAAIQRSLSDIGPLMKPLFYQDSGNTLFIEPNVTEQTIEEWQDWVTRTPQPKPGRRIPDWLDDFGLIPGTPEEWPPDPGDPRPDFIDPGSLINPQPAIDWLTNPATGLLFDGTLIGPAGRPEVDILTDNDVDTRPQGIQVNVNPGSGIASGSIMVLTSKGTLEQSGLTQAVGGLNVVGSAGFNSALAQNLNK
jgi:ABC toxin N-terminal region/Neuraminidase-like domain/Putative peptidoglycan binding domain/Salmonella virulence plasmid 28.1kDa A protein